MSGTSHLEKNMPLLCMLCAENLGVDHHLTYLKKKRVIERKTLGISESIRILVWHDVRCRKDLSEWTVKLLLLLFANCAFNQTCPGPMTTPDVEHHVNHAHLRKNMDAVMNALFHILVFVDV